ncbi:MAG TPA: YtxH domain-containing protein [Fimbriimonadaceae bacterium]|nr:YtxH domain-containing protein [Fimbriimonadaceae bacterium]
MLYLLAGVGIGAIIGAAAGILLAPKAGSEVREDISEKFLELKSKTESWIADQRAKRSSSDTAIEEVGA